MIVQITQLIIERVDRFKMAQMIPFAIFVKHEQATSITLTNV